MQSVSYMGDGSTTEFMFNFPYYENSNIIVTVNNTATSGYTIVGTPAGVNADIPYTGGKVVFDVAPSSLDTIKISRDLPLTRVVDYQPTVQLDPTTLNQDMNYMMEVLKDFSDKLDNFSVQYSEIVNKETAQNLITKIATVTEKINEFDDEIEQGIIMSRNEFYSYTTNCITEIPQDIKLEVNNGTLILKSGSKIYKPNGSGVFDIINITTDKTATFTTNGKRCIFINESGNMQQWAADSIFSGTTAPTSVHYPMWYDTANNVIQTSSDYGSTWSGSFSFPIAIVTVSNGTISSVDQVFNGFGYIGSTIFALPGVKALVPNGLNNDKGTLNNTLWSITNLITYTETSNSGTIDIAINTSNDSLVLDDYTYNPDTNYNYCNGSISNNIVIIGGVTLSSGAITSITFKKVLSLKLN